MPAIDETKFRRFTKVSFEESDGLYHFRVVEPETLKKGDLFKIHTSSPKDHLYGRNITFQAAADWDPKGEGPGGNIQVVIPMPSEGLVADPDILK